MMKVPLATVNCSEGPSSLLDVVCARLAQPPLSPSRWLTRWLGRSRARVRGNLKLSPLFT